MSSFYGIYTDSEVTASCVARVASTVPIGIAQKSLFKTYDPEALSTAVCGAQMPSAGVASSILPVGNLRAEDCSLAEDEVWPQ